MDMKQILQALDKASSRKVEGADDMRRFVSAVRALNQPVEEAAKPNDPGFKPNLQVPQAPPFPEGDFSAPGTHDLGSGEKLTVNKDGTRSHEGGFGTFVYDKAGKAIKYISPRFAGYGQEHDLTTGNITVKYMNGPMRVEKEYDKTGKPLNAQDVEYDMGVMKMRQQKDANNKVTNTASIPDGDATHVVQQQQPATEGKKSFLDYLALAESKKSKCTCEPDDKDPDCPVHGLEPMNVGDDLDEDKQKGVDGKACWDGYKRMGTKKKGGKTVDNCVPTGK